MSSLDRCATLFRACCCSAWGSFSPAPLTADDLADEADLKFRLGAEAYQRGDYTLALEEFLASNRLVQNRNVQYNVARCYEDLKQFPEAYRYYALALRDEPIRPRVHASSAPLGQIRQNVAVLEIESEPPGATVFVERRDLGPRGNAPLALGLKPGGYVVLASCPATIRRDSTCPKSRRGQSRHVTLALAPILGQVLVDEAAHGSSVRVDDAKQANRLRRSVPARFAGGSSPLRFERPGYQPTELEVDVHAKQQARVRPELTALTGSLVVSSDEPGALVEIDGKPSGFTPLVLAEPRRQATPCGFRSAASADRSRRGYRNWPRRTRRGHPDSSRRSDGSFALDGRRGGRAKARSASSRSASSRP